jgi:ribonuclease HI/probable phosphoglycerate mutase
MESNGVDRAAILRILAVKLPDTTLNKLFPHIPPQAVRDVMQGKSKIASPPAQQQELFAGPSPATAPACKLFTDGASRGNPGEAGAGIVLLDDSDQELAARYRYLGQCTNNAAEYKALILGLETALELGCRQLVIHMDSQLIVRQVQGQYKVKNASLKPLFNQAKSLLAKIATWQIEHIPRAQNKRADELANRGIDEKNR